MKENSPLKLSLVKDEHVKSLMDKMSGIIKDVGGTKNNGSGKTVEIKIPVEQVDDTIATSLKDKIVCVYNWSYSPNHRCFKIYGKAK